MILQFCKPQVQNGSRWAERSCHVCAPPRSSPRILSLALFGSSRLPLSSPAAPSSAPSLMATLPRLSRKDPGDSVRPARITWHGLPLSRNGPHGHSGVSVTTRGREGKGPHVRVHIGHAARALVLLWRPCPRLPRPTLPASPRRFRAAQGAATVLTTWLRKLSPVDAPHVLRREASPVRKGGGLQRSDSPSHLEQRSGRGRHPGQDAGAAHGVRAACLPRHGTMPPAGGQRFPETQPEEPTLPVSPTAAGHAVLTGRDPRNQATDSPLAKEVASER